MELTERQRQELYGKYRGICNEYLRLFCEKYGLEYSPDAWRDNQTGGSAKIGDVCVDMTELVTDCNEGAGKNEYFRWREYNWEVAWLNLATMSYREWLSGKPRIPQEDIDRIKKRQKELYEEADIIDRAF